MSSVIFAPSHLERSSVSLITIDLETRQSLQLVIFFLHPCELPLTSYIYKVKLYKLLKKSPVSWLQDYHKLNVHNISHH